MGITCQSPESSSPRCRHERLSCSFTQTSLPSNNAHSCLRHRDPLSAMQTDLTQPQGRPWGWKKRDVGVHTYQFFIFTLGIELGHFFRVWFLNNGSADQPDGQTCNEHPDIRHKHPDAITSVGSLQATGRRRREEVISHLYGKHLTAYSNLLSDLKSRMFVLPSSYQTALH